MATDTGFMANTCQGSQMLFFQDERKLSLCMGVFGINMTVVTLDGPPPIKAFGERRFLKLSAEIIAITTN
jgi:hypothetical protein